MEENNTGLVNARNRFDINPYGKQYIILKDFEKLEQYSANWDYYHKGHIIKQCKDGWYHLFQNRTDSPRCSQKRITELVNEGLIKQI